MSPTVFPFSYIYTMFLLDRFFFFFSSRRRHTRYWRDWSSDVCSSDLSSAQLLHRRGESVDFRLGPLLGHGHENGISQLRIPAAQGESREVAGAAQLRERSEERRVGKECSTRWWLKREQGQQRERDELA